MKSDFSQSTFTKYHSLLNVLHVCVLSRFSHVQLFEILWTVASQARILEWVAMPSSRSSS